MTKIDSFLSSSYADGSYNAVLRVFLGKQSKRGVSVHTVARLYYTLSPIGRALGNPSLVAIKKHQIRKYADNLWLTYTPDTIRTIIGDMRQFFGWCKKKKYVKKNLVKGVKPVRRRSKRRGRKAALDDNIHVLLHLLVGKLKGNDLIYRDLFGTLSVEEGAWSYCNLQVLRDLFIVVFLYETGARGGELSALGSVVMNRATRIPDTTYLITVYGKTHDRDLRFTECTAELWRIWQLKRPYDNRLALFGWRNGHDPQRLTTNGISQMLMRRCTQAGVKPCRAHALRHAKIRRSRREVGLEMASLLVDHSNLETTRGYDWESDEEISAAVIKTGLKFDLWK